MKLLNALLLTAHFSYQAVRDPIKSSIKEVYAVEVDKYHRDPMGTHRNFDRLDAQLWRIDCLQTSSWARGR